MLNISEANEISVEDLEAACGYYDKLIGGRPVKILFVDDTQSIRDTMKLAMRSINADLTICECPHEAVRNFYENQYDLIISDYQMPGACKHYFETICSKQTPVVIWTGHCSPNVPEKAKVVFKTISPLEFIEQIASGRFTKEN